MLQGRPRAGHRQGMLTEGAAKEGGLDRGSGIIPVLPPTSVDAIEVSGLARHNADGQASPGDFAVHHQVRVNSKMGLGPAGMNTETSDHLVENQGHSQFLGQGAQLMQKLAGLQVGPAALHWFHQHGCQLSGVCPDRTQGLWHPVVKHQQVVDHALGDARGKRVHPVGISHPQHHFRVAVIGAGKDGDLQASADGACQPQGRTHRL